MTLTRDHYLALAFVLDRPEPHSFLLWRRLLNAEARIRWGLVKARGGLRG